MALPLEQLDPRELVIAAHDMVQTIVKAEGTRTLIAGMGERLLMKNVR
jgi:hypothetical protein